MIRSGLAGGDTNIRRYVGNDPDDLIDPPGLTHVPFADGS